MRKIDFPIERIYSEVFNPPTLHSGLFSVGRDKQRLARVLTLALILPFI